MKEDTLAAAESVPAEAGGEVAALPRKRSRLRVERKPQSGGRAATVPLRAILLSLAALSIPVAGSIFLPELAGDYEILLWLLALVPAFLLAYYRGWRGAATALAAGMAALSLTQVALLGLGRQVESWNLLLAFTAVYIGLSLAIGYLSEMLHVAWSQAEHLALTDELTLLPNRRQAWLLLEREFAAAQRGRPLAVVLFDIDRFKQYNDRNGHLAGDDALRLLGRVLGENTRKMNLSARWGGEEFIAILSGADLESARRYAERMRTLLSKAGANFTMSGGVAAYEPSMQDPTDLIDAADRALYRAKGIGRDRVCLADPALAPAESGA